MSLELVEDAFGDARNAQFLAHASDLAYFNEAEGAPKFKDELGLDARLFSVGNTQAYLATNGDHIVVAFRGTESPTTIDGLKDWLLTDANNLLIVPEGRLGTDLAAAGVGARFHQGFVNAIADIWDPLFAALDAERKKQDRPIWLTGHSLGGALALLAAWLLRRKFVAVHQVYTFGGPMIGNREAIAALDKEYAGKIFRFVNAPDPVPMLPTMSLLANHYGHCEKEMVLGAAATAAAAGITSAADFFGQFAAQVKEDGLTSALIDGIWGKLKERVAAHSMVNYRELVAKLLNQ
jgi:pimeloyl-ACP methyl ester carboxylesterase